VYNPEFSDLFLRFKEKDEILVDGAVDAVLSALTVQIKLKYKSPPPPP
jgi:hypothetical protein